MLHITLTSTFIWLYHIHFTDVSWWWTGLQRYYTLLGFIRSFWSFLHLFASQMGGGPLLHWSIGSRLRWRLFWRLHINSSWSSGTMLLTCNNIGHSKFIRIVRKWSLPQAEAAWGPGWVRQPWQRDPGDDGNGSAPPCSGCHRWKKEELFLAKVVLDSFNG